jgi:carboxymethylenebutenolidase
LTPGRARPLIGAFEKGRVDGMGADGGTKISFDTGSGKADGYLVRPPAERAGVVVIQEWWGLVPHIEDIARRYAQLGFVALAPDLYHGKTTTEEAEAKHLLGGLDWGRATAELAAAVRHLREAEGCTKVFVTGFCMGGALTLLAATQGGVDGYAAYYGFPPEGAPVDQIKAPGLIFFGEHETFFSVPNAKAFAERQRQKGIDTELIVYPGAKHGFFNDTRPEVHHPEASNDAWRRTLAFFGRLRGTATAAAPTPPRAAKTATPSSGAAAPARPKSGKQGAKR